MQDRTGQIRGQRNVHRPWRRRGDIVHGHPLQQARIIAGQTTELEAELITVDAIVAAQMYRAGKGQSGQLPYRFRQILYPDGGAILIVKQRRGHTLAETVLQPVAEGSAAVQRSTVNERCADDDVVGTQGADVLFRRHFGVTVKADGVDRIVFTIKALAAVEHHIAGDKDHPRVVLSGILGEQARGFHVEAAGLLRSFFAIVKVAVGGAVNDQRGFAGQEKALQTGRVAQIQGVCGQRQRRNRMAVIQGRDGLLMRAGPAEITTEKAARSGDENGMHGTFMNRMNNNSKHTGLAGKRLWPGLCLWALLGAGLVYWSGCGTAEQPVPVVVPPPPAEARWLRSEAQVRRGDTLEKILQREGLPPEQIRPFVQAFASVYDVRKINVDKTYQLYTDSAGVWQRWEYLAEPEWTVQVQRDTLGQFVARDVRLELVKKIRALSGRLQSSLYESVLALGESPELIVRYSDVFQWDLDFFSDPQPGDEFRMVYEAYYIKDPSRPDSVGAFVRYGNVLAGEYQQPKNRLVAVYYQPAPERGGYYDLDGKSFQKTFRKSPLSYGRVTSRFSGARRHPILKIVRAHYAIDIAAPRGTPVLAPADGTIIERGYNQSIGNFLKIRHRNPHFVTLYGHLHAFADSMTVGKSVRQNDEVGYVGSTGLATGPHLHYVFYENGRPINPERIKNSSGDPLPSERLADYVLVRDRMLAWLNRASGQPAFIDTTRAAMGHVAGDDPDSPAARN